MFQSCASVRVFIAL